MNSLLYSIEVREPYEEKSRIKQRGGKTMKRFIITATAILLILYSFVSCQNMQTAKVIPEKAEDMLRYLPGDVNGIFFIDFHRGINLEFMDKIIKDEEHFEDYLEFAEKTGIDPQKDIYFIAGAIRGEMKKDDEDVVAIINLKYDKNTLITLIQQEAEKEGEEINEENYSGFMIYSPPEKEKKKRGSFCFLNESYITLGKKDAVKSVIDVFQKKEVSVLKNKAFSSLFSKTNKESLLWGGIIIPTEQKSLLTENPMFTDMESIDAISMAFDYKEQNIILDIHLMVRDPIKSQEMADKLNEFKSMGAMIQIQDLDMAELLDRIEINSGGDHVRIFASFPEDLPKILLEKLKLEKTGCEEKKS